MKVSLSWILLPCVLLVSGCGGKFSGSKPTALGTNDLVQVERQDLEFNIQVIGDLNPSLKVDVKAEISAKVKKICVIIGHTIERGTLLVELDDTDLLTEKASAKTEIEGARLSLDKSRLAAERGSRLGASELISKQELDNLNLDWKIAQNNLDKAQKKLDTVDAKLIKTKIYAPIDGSIITLPIVEGQVVIGGPSAASGTLLMSLANLKEMLITAHVNQLDIAHLQVESPVVVQVDAFDNLTLEGKVLFIAPMATVKNNMKGFSVDILVKNPDPRIRPGMSANVKIPIFKSPQALSVPIQSVFRAGRKKVVYVREGDKLVSRDVEVGITTADRVEVKAGINEGDWVSLVRPKSRDAAGKPM